MDEPTIPKIEVSNTKRKSIWIHTRADSNLVLLIESYAQSKGITNRSQAIRELLQKGLLVKP